MKKAVLLLLLIIVASFALNKENARIQTILNDDKTTPVNTYNYIAPATNNTPQTFGPKFILGRQEIVGFTYYDWQLNGPAYSHCIYNPVSNGIHCYWMYDISEDPAAPARNERYNFFDFSANSWNWPSPGYGINTYTLRAGFGGFTVDPITGNAVASAHTSDEGILTPNIARDAAPGTGIFEYSVGPRGLQWPVPAVSNNQAIHVITVDGTTSDSIWYVRNNPWGTWTSRMRIIQSTDQAPLFPNHNIFASPTSNKVVLLWEESQPAGTALQERAWYRMSTDGGVTWGDVTQIPYPPAFGDYVGYLPSFHITSLYGMFDASDNMHIIAGVNAVYDEGSYVLPAEIWHYCPTLTPSWTLVSTHDADSLACPVGTNAIFACRPSIAANPTNGYLYASWEVFDPLNYEPTTTVLRADIWVAESPNNGITWTRRGKITDPDMTSKRFPSVGGAKDDTIFVQYVIDSIAGFAAGSTPTGRYSNNPVVLHRVHRLSLPQVAYNDDVGVMSIQAPGDWHAVNLPLTPKARVKNYGANTQTGFAVYCTIYGTGGAVRYVTSATLTLLPSQDSTISFPTWTSPSVTEEVTVVMKAYIAGDEYTANDRKTSTCDILFYTDGEITTIASPTTTAEKRNFVTPRYTVANNGSAAINVDAVAYFYAPPTTIFSEGFNGTAFPPAGWDTIILYAASDTNIAQNWTRVTAGTWPVCTPYEGAGMARYNSWYLDSMSHARLVTPTINLPDNNQSLYFVMHLDPQINYRRDSLAVEISTDGGTNWTSLARYSRYSNTVYGWKQRIIPLSAYSGNVKIAFHGISAYGNDVHIDYVQVGASSVAYADTQTVNIGAGERAELEITYDPVYIEHHGTYYFEAIANVSGDMDPDNNNKDVLVMVPTLPMTLVEPTNGAFFSDNTPYFNWDDITWATSYRIQVDDNSDFSSPVINELTASSEWQVMAGSELADGHYYWHVRVETPGDPDPYSGTWDFSIGTLVPGWHQMENMPSTQVAKNKYIKDGGSLVSNGTYIYGFRGNKSSDFYQYNLLGEGTWTTLDSMKWGYKPTDPTAYNKKQISKGAALCWDGANTIYAIKGNSTKEFWAYDITLNTWTAKEYLPVLKQVKKGSSLAYANGLVYLLYGGHKNTEANFFSYDPNTNTWNTGLMSAPQTPDGKVYKDGSCLSAIGNTIYALKGKGKANHFYSYDIPTNTWTYIDTIPLVHPQVTKKVKVGDGGAMTNDGTNLYMIKGGGKQDFWMYTPGTPGTFTALEMVPLLAGNKKSVPKAGAAVTWQNGAMYLIKGNNLAEYWQFVPTTAVAKANPVTRVAVNSNPTPKLEFSVSSGFATNAVNYTVPVSGNVSIKLYNATGRLVETLYNGYANAGNYSLTLSNISNGVYFLKYEDASNRKELKVIVQ